MKNSKNGIKKSKSERKIKNPKISILVPAYNEEVVIRDTLKQLVEEVEYPNVEIIVGVDNGDDKTLEIANKFAKDYENVSVDYDPIRRGVTAKVNSGLKKATGDIIIKFDADMRFGNPKTALYNIAKYFESPEVGAIYYAGERDFHRGVYEYMEPKYIPELIKEREKSMASRAENFMAILVHQYRMPFFPIKDKSPIPIDTHCFRRNLVTQLDSMIVHDDIEFARNVLEKGYTIVFAPDVIVFTPGGQPYSAKDLWNQKIKGNVGWLQMRKRNNLNFTKYCFGIFLVFIKNIHRCRFKDVVAFFYWCVIYACSFMIAFPKRHQKPTEVWKRWKRV